MIKIKVIEHTQFSLMHDDDYNSITYTNPRNRLNKLHNKIYCTFSSMYPKMSEPIDKKFCSFVLIIYKCAKQITDNNNIVINSLKTKCNPINHELLCEDFNKAISEFYYFYKIKDWFDHIHVNKPEDSDKRHIEKEISQKLSIVYSCLFKIYSTKRTLIDDDAYVNNYGLTLFGCMSFCNQERKPNYPTRFGEDQMLSNSMKLIITSNIMANEIIAEIKKYQQTSKLTQSNINRPTITKASISIQTEDLTR